MILKSSSFGGISIQTIIVLCLSIQTIRSSQAFSNEDDSEFLDLYKEEEPTPRFFFGNNGSLILDTRTTLVLAALFGPLLAAIPILLALLSDQGGDEKPSHGYGSGSGYDGGYGGGGGGAYGGGGGGGGGYGGYGYARQTAVGADGNKQQRNFRKRSAMEDYESLGKFCWRNLSFFTIIFLLVLFFK